MKCSALAGKLRFHMGWGERVCQHIAVSHSTNKLNVYTCFCFGFCCCFYVALLFHFKFNEICILSWNFHIGANFSHLAFCYCFTSHSYFWTWKWEYFFVVYLNNWIVNYIRYISKENHLEHIFSVSFCYMRLYMDQAL